MENPESIKPPEIPNVDGQQLSDAMHIHTRSQSGVMDLHTLDLMRDQKSAPALVDLPAVRQELKTMFDHARQAIRLADAQTEPILVERPGCRVPELAQGL